MGKVFLPINSVSSSLESNWKMVVPFRTTISRRNQHCTWCSVFAVECRHRKSMYRIDIAFQLTCKRTLLLESIRTTPYSPRTRTSLGVGIAYDACEVYFWSQGIYVQKLRIPPKMLEKK